MDRQIDRLTATKTDGQTSSNWIDKKTYGQTNRQMD
jgi:hypothetical protein